MAASTATTSFPLHHQNPNPNSHHFLLCSSSSTAAARRRGAKCAARSPPPPAAAAGELEGQDVSTRVSTRVLLEGQIQMCPLSSHAMSLSTRAIAASTMVSPVSLNLLHQHPQNHHPCSPSKSQGHNPTHKNPKAPILPRRSCLLIPASFLLLHSSSSFAIDDTTSPSTSTPSSTIDTTITDRIFIDFSVCPSYFRSDRTLGDELAACPDAEPLGRVVFGLYGHLLPLTTANFKATCTATAYRGTLVHKLLQGQFFVAGRQGIRRDKGGVQPPPGLARNAEAVDPKAFELRHVRPGTLSLCLGQNDDDDEIKLKPNYHNVEFLVTTGPGPCPELDGQNIVFGTVLEGMDVVSSIASIPTYRPAERIRLFNEFAEFIGDERAQSARAMWNRPLKTVYISNCGELKVTNPSLSPPSLP